MIKTTTRKTTEKKETKPVVKPIQEGTGIHLDCLPYTKDFIGEIPFCKIPESGIVSEGEWIVKNVLDNPMGRFRPIQAFVALTDQKSDLKDTNSSLSATDGGLEICPGFSRFALEYYNKHPVPHHGNQKFHSYVTTCSRKQDPIIYNGIQRIGRIPEDWDPKNYKNSIEDPSQLNFEEIVNAIGEISNEHKKLKLRPYKSGDYVLWFETSPHQNGKKNESTLRRVFYHSYLAPVKNKKINGTIFERQKRGLSSQTRPISVRSDYQKLEQNLTIGDEKCAIIDKGMEFLYDPMEKTPFNFDKKVLSEKQLAYLQRYGYLVMENVYSHQEVDQLNLEIDEAIVKLSGIYAPIDEKDSRNKFKELRENIFDKWDDFMFEPDQWRKLAGKFGGVLDFYYLPTMMKMRQSELTFKVVSEITEHFWCSNKSPMSFRDEIDFKNLKIYLDRVNNRFPTGLVDKIRSIEKKKADLEWEKTHPKLTNEKKRKNGAIGSNPIMKKLKIK